MLCDYCEHEQSWYYWLDLEIGSGSLIGPSCLRQLAGRVSDEDIASAQEKESDVQQIVVGGNQGEKGKTQFPPFYKLTDGAELVAYAKQVRFDQPGNFGPQTIVDVFIKGQKSVHPEGIWSIGWPKRLPAPQVLVPFYFKRRSSWEYVFMQASNGEEACALWDGGVEFAKKVPVETVAASEPAFLKKSDAPKSPVS